MCQVVVLVTGKTSGQPASNVEESFAEMGVIMQAILEEERWRQRKLKSAK